MDFSTAKKESPPCQSALIAMKVHCHHGGQRWWARTAVGRRDNARRQTADPAGILAVCSRRSGRSSTEQPCSQGFLDKAMYLDADSPGKTDSDLDFIQAATGEDWQHFVEKEAFALENGGVVGRVRGKKAPFFRTARLTWAAFSRETAGKRRRRV